jgi:tetratricopeptide (TPR) repeat protein
MTESTSRSNNMRDAVIIAGVLLIFTIGYIVLKSPQEMPAPRAQQPQQTTQAGMGDMASAMPDLPNDYDGLVTTGNRYMDQDNYPVAAEAYRRALEIDGSSVDVRTDFGACLDAMGLPDRALEEFHRVLQLDPNHAIAQFNLGVVYYEKQQFDSTRYYLNKYLTLQPNGRAADAARGLLKQLDG